jgi:hypothetical protein
MREQWKPIPDWSYYEASSLGRIRRAVPGRKTFVGKILSPKTMNSGYLTVQLYRAGESGYQRRTMLIHRLIATTFIGDRPEGTEINHKDGNKFDSRLSNLEYVTRKVHIERTRQLALRGKWTRQFIRFTKRAATCLHECGDVFQIRGKKVVCPTCLRSVGSI